MNVFDKFSSVEPQQRPLVDVLTAILDALPANIALLDSQGVILTTNAAWRNFGRENGHPPDFAGERTNYLAVCERAALHGCNEAATTAAGLRAVIDGSQADFSLEYPCHSPSEQRWFRLMASPVTLGKDRGVVVMHINITERRSAQLIIREQAELLDHAHDAIAVRDEKDIIKYWNKSAERLYGWTAEEAVGKNFRSLMKCKPDQFDEALRVVMENGSWDGRIEKVTKDGRTLIVEGSWSRFVNESSGRQSLMTIDTDITQRTQLELQFLRAQRLESIGTLAGGIAHDLNNLLAPITVGIDLLRSQINDPKSAPIIDNIQRSAKRGASLVQQVLSFARGVEGTRVVLQVRHIIREIESIVESTFPKNVRWEDRSDRELWTIVADPTQIHQVLLNICVNARDAMPDGGVLSIAARNVELDAQYAVMNRGVAAGRYLLLQIEDTGIGMTREVMDRIFEPFFTTKEIGIGTGLGLSTVAGIVRSHGGFINVYSEVGRGSTFKIYLPADRSGNSQKSQNPFSDEMPRGNGELILVVDDEAPILSVTRQTLESFNYRVIVAEDGAAAIAAFAQRSKEIDVVLTDMMMPVMDGPALIAALRRINPAVRVIATSGLHGNAALARAMSNGIQHFLPKPFTADSLLKTLRDTILKPSL